MCVCVCVKRRTPREPPVHSPVGTVAFRKQTAPFIESGFGLVDSQSPLVTLVALGTRQAAQTEDLSLTARLGRSFLCAHLLFLFLD